MPYMACCIIVLVRVETWFSNNLNDINIALCHDAMINCMAQDGQHLPGILMIEGCGSNVSPSLHHSCMLSEPCPLRGQKTSKCPHLQFVENKWAFAMVEGRCLIKLVQ
jgi:hypothetical protein